MKWYFCDTNIDWLVNQLITVEGKTKSFNFSFFEPHSSACRKPLTPPPIFDYGFPFSLWRGNLGQKTHIYWFKINFSPSFFDRAACLAPILRFKKSFPHLLSRVNRAFRSDLVICEKKSVMIQSQAFLQLLSTVVNFIFCEHFSKSCKSVVFDHSKHCQVGKER